MRTLKHKNILLVGGYNKTKALAKSLLTQGYHVTIINENYDECMDIAQIEGIHVYNGDGTKLYVLDEAGAADCSIAIALSSHDDDNLVACQLCKRNFGVKKTVSLVSDPQKTDFFYQMGVDSVVCAISAVTNIIQQQAFIDDLVNVIPVDLGAVQIIEVSIPENAPVSGKSLWEIELPHEVVIGCILRNGCALIPHGDTKINAGDTLIVIAHSDKIQKAVHLLTWKV